MRKTAIGHLREVAWGLWTGQQLLVEERVPLFNAGGRRIIGLLLLFLLLLLFCFVLFVCVCFVCLLVFCFVLFFCFVFFCCATSGLLVDMSCGVPGVEIRLLVGCLTSQRHTSASQGRICSDNFTYCHTEIEVADQSFYLTQSQYTDTGPTSPSIDPITAGD